MIGCLPTQTLAFLAVFVYATHASDCYFVVDVVDDLAAAVVVVAVVAGCRCGADLLLLQRRGNDDGDATCDENKQ